MNNPNMQLKINDETEKNESLKKSAGITFIILGIFSAVNLILLTTQISTSYLFFSAWACYFLTDYTMAYCLKFPVESYNGAYEKYAQNKLDDSAFVIAVIISSAIALAYILVWFLSRRENAKIPFIIGLALTIADACILIASLTLIPLSSTVVLSFAFHFILIFQQIMGIKASYKLCKQNI